MMMLPTGLGLFIFGSDDAASATVIYQGTITSDEIWNASGSPYYIEGNVTLAYGVNLTIEAGVSVRFNGYHSLYIGGNLTAVGNATDMITFTSNSSSPQPVYWGSIQVNLTGRATMKYCNITYGTYGIEAIMSSDNDFEYNNITDNYYAGITLSQSSNTTISNNNIMYNYFDGITLYQSSDNNISGNNISDNQNNGLFLSESHNNDIDGNNVMQNWFYGVFLSKSRDNNITNNHIWSSYRGLYLSGTSGDQSKNNTIRLNSIHSNSEGIRLLSFCPGNIISKNNVSSNANGVNITSSSNNRLFHNIFWNNTLQAYDSTSANFWDDGYPSGGNYWSDFDEPGEGAYDNNTGPNQDEAGSDGIVDDRYIKIAGGAGAQDNYPLARPSLERVFVYLISPINNSVVPPATVLDFVVVGEDVVLVEYSLDGGLINTTLPPPWNIDITGWLDGPFIIDVYVYNSQGNMTAFWFNITIDSIKPEIMLNAPPNGSLILPGVQIDLTVSDTNLADVSYTINGGANSTLLAPYDIDSTTWADGNNTIQIYALDMAGNLNTAIYNFTVDGSSPSIALLEPANNSVVRAGTSLLFNISDPHLNTSAVNYSVNGQAPEKFTTLYEIDTAAWADDNYTIEVSATDNLGNVNTTSFNFVVDSTPPLISLVSPLNNSVLSEAEILDFEIVDVHLDFVNYTVNSGSNITLPPPFDIDPASWPDGPYRIDIFAADVVGNTNTSFYYITLSTPPRIILYSPYNNSVTRAGAIIDFRIEDTNLDRVNYSIDEGGEIPLPTPFDINTTGWEDDNYIITVFAWDTAGNTNSSWYNFTIDSTAPYITLNSPSNDSYFPPGPIIDFDILDAHLISVSYSVNGDPFNPFPPPYDFDTGSWDDGNYSIVIIANDDPGNVNISEFEFTVDSAPPIIQLLSPPNGTSMEIGTPINLAVFDENLDYAQYSVNFGVNTTLTFPYTINTSTWLDGDYTITVLAMDLANNSCLTWYEFTLNDTLKPMIVLNSPSNLSVILPGTVIDLDIIELNLRNVNYSLDNAAVTTLDFPYNISTSDWSEGLHTLTVHADDVYNHTNSSVFVFTIDSEKPLIFLDGPINNTVILSGHVLDFDVADDNLNAVSHSINGGASQAFVSPFDISTTGWGDGVYIITIQASDLAGNENSAWFRFIIDSTTPVISLNSPVNGSSIQQGTVIDFTVSDTNLVTVEYRIDDGSWDALAPPYDVDTTGLADGSCVIEISADDAAGNGIYASFTFILDGTPPEVSHVTVVEPYYPYNNTQIIISFTEPMNTDSVELSLSITPGLDYTFSWYDGDMTLILKNIDGMQLNGFYSVHLGDGAEDLAGNPLVNFPDYGFLATIDIYLDTDEDGMTDGWEFLYGLDPNDPSDADQDADEDGYTNLEEFEGGSDPTDPNSVPFKPKEEPSALEYWWVVPILVALLIVTIVLFVLLMRGEGKEEPKGPEEEMEDLYLRMRAEEDIRAMESLLSDKAKAGEGTDEAEIVVQKAREAFAKGDYNLVTVYEKTLRDILGEGIEEGVGDGNGEKRDGDRKENMDSDVSNEES